jgi:hypothetical protein
MYILISLLLNLKHSQIPGILFKYLFHLFHPKASRLFRMEQINLEALGWNKLAFYIRHEGFNKKGKVSAHPL